MCFFFFLFEKTLFLYDFQKKNKSCTIATWTELRKVLGHPELCEAREELDEETGAQCGDDQWIALGPSDT